MRLEQLEQVVQIHQWGSFNLAAQYLHMTHQNLSRSIQTLEKELDITIFSRDTKGAILTKDGEAVYSFALTVMNEHRNLQDKIQANKDNLDILNTFQYSSLKIALTTSLDLIIKPLLYNLTHNRNYIAINCMELNMTECIKQAEEKTEYDLIFLQNDYDSFLNHSKPAANYMLLFLTVEKVELVASKSSPYAQYGTITRDMFEKIPLICYSHDSMPSNIAQVCINRNIHPNIISYSNLTSIMQESLTFGRVHTIAVPSTQKLIWGNPLIRDQMISLPIELPFRIATAVWIKRELCQTPLGSEIIRILKQAYEKTIEEIY